jgi:hypothetical protein
MSDRWFNSLERQQFPASRFPPLKPLFFILFIDLIRTYEAEDAFNVVHGVSSTQGLSMFELT